MDASVHSNPAPSTAGPFATVFLIVAAIPGYVSVWPILPLPDALAAAATTLLVAVLTGMIVKRVAHRRGPLAGALLCGSAAAVALWSTVLALSRVGVPDQTVAVASGCLWAVGVFVVSERLAARQTGLKRQIVVFAAAALAALPLPLTFSAAGQFPSLAAPSSAGSEAVDPLDYVKAADFVERPNVYLIGMLSAVPDALLDRHLGTGPSPLNDYLRQHFRVFSNVFSETYTTRASYDLLLSLNQDYLLDLNDLVPGGLLSGALPSPLLTIFARNGYETNALYEDTKFGAVKGPYVDHYELALPASLCSDNFINEPERSLAFFGACVLSRAYPLSALKPSLDAVFARHLIQIARIGERSRPQLTIMHMRPPFHYSGPKLKAADPDAVRDFTGRYERGTSVAAANLQRLVDQIRQDDPTALLFVFGDQGLGLSEDDGISPFFVQDRLGVIGAVSPAGACAEYLPSPSTRASITTVQILSSLISCLSGGDSVHDAGYRHKALIDRQTIDLEPYVYE